MNAAPFCFSCGYSMIGLELPRPCPECGVLVDPPAQIEAARRWADSPKPWWWLFSRSRDLPAGLLYTLTDPVSVWIARRRVFLSIWLPAFLTSAIVFVGTTVVVEYDITLRYYRRAQPSGPAVKVENRRERDRLFNLNLHLYGLFEPPGRTLVEGPPENRTLRVELPPSVDPVSLFLGCTPLAVLLLGYFPARVLLAFFARRGGRRLGQPGFRVAVRTAARLLSLPAGASAWLWLLFVVCFGIGQMWKPKPSSLEEYALQGLFVITCAAFLVLTCLGWWRFVRLDGARAVFPARGVLLLLLLGINIAGPVVACWFLVTVVLS